MHPQIAPGPIAGGLAGLRRIRVISGSTFEMTICDPNWRLRNQFSKSGMLEDHWSNALYSWFEILSALIRIPNMCTLSLAPKTLHVSRDQAAWSGMWISIRDGGRGDRNCGIALYLTSNVELRIRQRLPASGELRVDQSEAESEAGNIYWAIDWFLRESILESTIHDLVPCFNKSTSGIFDSPLHEPWLCWLWLLSDPHNTLRSRLFIALCPHLPGNRTAKSLTI